MGRYSPSYTRIKDFVKPLHKRDFTEEAFFILCKAHSSCLVFKRLEEWWLKYRLSYGFIWKYFTWSRNKASIFKANYHHGAASSLVNLQSIIRSINIQPFTKPESITVNNTAFWYVTSCSCFYYDDNKSPPLDPILSQLNAVYTPIIRSFIMPINPILPTTG
jgi:hypothetical protein